MRTLLTLIVIGAIGLVIFKFRADTLHRIDNDPAATPAASHPLKVESVSPAANNGSEVATAPAAESTSAAASAPPDPTPAQPQFRTAPPGTFFLAQRVSVITDNGVVAALPGEQVKFMYRNKNGTVRVLFGKQELEVRDDQLTKEVDASSGRPIAAPNVPKDAVAAQH